MVEQDSEQATLLLNHIDKNECEYGNERISFKKLDTEEEKISDALVFIFPIQQADKCKAFLKRCHDDKTITLDLNKIVIETRLRQKVDKRVYGLDKDI